MAPSLVVANRGKFARRRGKVTGAKTRLASERRARRAARAAIDARGDRWRSAEEKRRRETLVIVALFVVKNERRATLSARTC